MMNDILKFLGEKEYISGEVLAQKLGISRVAVWKQIQKLKDMGYKIISDQNLGYCLVSRPDLLLPQEIQRGLSTNYIGKEIYYFPELKSTNEGEIRPGMVFTCRGYLAFHNIVPSTFSLLYISNNFNDCSSGSKVYQDMHSN